MRYLLLTTTLLLTAACAPGFGGPADIALPAAALRTEAGVKPAAAAAAIAEANAEVVLLAAPEDPSWFRAVARAANLNLSGPGRAAGNLGLAFLAREAVGDTTIELTYDGGRFTVQDALYDLDDERYLDLLAFQVPNAAAARPLTSSLLDYIATDVDPTAAVIMAVAVPNAEVGDSVAAMLSPLYEDAITCETGPAARATRGSIRLFYGPEARVYCENAVATDLPIGDRVRASLVAGRR